MTKYGVLLIYLLFLTMYSPAQEAGFFPSLDINDFPEAIFQSSGTYNGASLYGYMDGGADLYLEYGFAEAKVDEISMKGKKFIIEIFRMSSPEEAFGIYSVCRYRCDKTPGLSPFCCLTQYQMQISQGPYYINIINRAGNFADSSVLLKIGKALAGQITEKPADIGSFFPGIPVDDMNRDALLVKGPLGIRNGAPDLEEYIPDNAEFTGVILQKPRQILISLRFHSLSDTEDYLSKMNLNKVAGLTKGKNDKTLSVQRLSDTHLILNINNP